MTHLDQPLTNHVTNLKPNEVMKLTNLTNCPNLSPYSSLFLPCLYPTLTNLFNNRLVRLVRLVKGNTGAGFSMTNLCFVVGQRLVK